MTRFPDPQAVTGEKPVLAAPFSLSALSRRPASRSGGAPPPPAGCSYRLLMFTPQIRRQAGQLRKAGVPSAAIVAGLFERGARNGW
jgi:hypothetical protein